MIKVEQNALVSPVETREELLYLLTRASELEHELSLLVPLRRLFDQDER